MFCTNCGAQNVADARFCEGCGKTIGAQSVAASVPYSPPPPAFSAHQPPPIHPPLIQPPPINDPRIRGYNAPPPIQSPRNPGLALALSLIVPGAGQFYNGQIGKGVITLVAYFISWIATVIVIGFFGVFGIWIWSMIDAYQTAQASVPRY